tara:strand:+ start:135 stop:305 length:171 start_codon:yes stop_codon:yes gene_type:complete
MYRIFVGGLKMVAETMNEDVAILVYREYVERSKGLDNFAEYRPWYGQKIRMIFSPN